MKTFFWSKEMSDEERKLIFHITHFYIWRNSQIVKPESALLFLELLRATESLLFPRKKIQLKCNFTALIKQNVKLKKLLT